MKNLLNSIPQEEKERILEMHKLHKNVITEQSDDRPGVVKQVVSFEKPESKKINNLFMKEFLPSLTPGRNKLTSREYADELKNITDQQLLPVISFFTSKGYKQPNNLIKDFQEELTRVTGIDKYTNIETLNNEFKDGTFGVATARALINKFIKSLESVASRGDNRTVGEIFKSAESNITDPRMIKTQSVAPSVPAGKEQQIDIGTQKIK